MSITIVLPLNHMKYILNSYVLSSYTQSYVNIVVLHHDEGHHGGGVMKMRFATQHKFSCNPPRGTSCWETRWGPVGTNGQASCVVWNYHFVS